MGDFDWCFYLKLIFGDDDIQVKLSSRSPQANVHLTPRCSGNLKSPKISLKEYFSITAYRSCIHLRYLNLWLVTSPYAPDLCEHLVRPDCWCSKSSCLAWNGGYLRCPWQTSWKCNSLGGKAEKKSDGLKVGRQHLKLVVYFTNLKLGSKSGGYQIRGTKLALYYYPWILSRIFSFWFSTVFFCVEKMVQDLSFSA